MIQIIYLLNEKKQNKQADLSTVNFQLFQI